MSWKIEYNKEAVRNLEKIATLEKNKIFKGIELLTHLTQKLVLNGSDIYVGEN